MDDDGDGWRAPSDTVANGEQKDHTSRPRRVEGNYKGRGPWGLYISDSVTLRCNNVGAIHQWNSLNAVIQPSDNAVEFTANREGK